MRQLSHKFLSFFFKRVFPALWLGGLAFSLVRNMTHAGLNHHLLIFVNACFLIFGTYFFMKLHSTLADDVVDCGDYLIIRKNGAENHVSISNIENIKFQGNMGTIKLAEPASDSSEFKFIAITGIDPEKEPAIEDLIKRVDEARVKRTAIKSM